MLFTVQDLAIIHEILDLLPHVFFDRLLHVLHIENQPVFLVQLPEQRLVNMVALVVLGPIVGAYLLPVFQQRHLSIVDFLLGDPGTTVDINGWKFAHIALLHHWVYIVC